MFFGLNEDDEDYTVKANPEYYTIIKTVLHELKPLRPVLFQRYGESILEEYKHKKLTDTVRKEFRDRLFKFRPDLYRHENTLLHRKANAALYNNATVKDEKLTADVDYATKSINRTYRINNVKQTMF